jgi:hypothetical protein
MFVAAIILKIVFSLTPPPRPDMTLQADGLVETKSVAEAQPHTVMPILLPSDLLQSTVYSVGIYTKGAATLPVGSADITLVKNDWRFVEIIERPSTTLEDVANDYVGASSEIVSLGRADAVLLRLPRRGIRCVEPNAKWQLPGFCEISRILMFETDGIVYSIAADGTHATDGELATLAKSMLP